MAKNDARSDEQQPLQFSPQEPSLNCKIGCGGVYEMSFMFIIQVSTSVVINKKIILVVGDRANVKTNVVLWYAK